MKAGDSQLSALRRGARPVRRRPFYVALAVLISTLLLVVAVAPAKPSKGKTLHLTAVVKKAKATGGKMSRSDLVTLALRSGSKPAGKIKTRCDVEGALNLQCRSQTARLNGLGSKLFIAVTWTCFTTHPGCARFATGFVTSNSSGVVLGTVRFKTPAPAGKNLTLAHQFPVVIHLKKG